MLSLASLGATPHKAGEMDPPMPFKSPMRSLSWLSRLVPGTAPAFGERATPSVDLYFLYGVADLVGEGKAYPIRRLGNNLFAAGDAYVLLRYGAEAELQHLESARRRCLFYVIDDDFAALAGDETLPTGYRRRMAAFAARVLPRILALEPEIVAPSRRLIAALGRPQGHIIEPAHAVISDDLSHFDRPDPLRLVFAATRSHAADLAAIAPGIAAFLDHHPQGRLVTFLGRHAPAPLDRHAQVDNRTALDWPDYKQVLMHERFHLALTPMRASPANLARSANKVNDHAAFGAAGLYSRIGPYCDRITHGRDGLLVGDSAEDWRSALSQFASHPDGMRTIAQAGIALAKKRGNPQRLRQFWKRLLEL